MKRGVKKIIFMSVAIATFCSLAAFSGKGKYQCMQGFQHGHGCMEKQSLMHENHCGAHETYKADQANTTAQNPDSTK